MNDPQKIHDFLRSIGDTTRLNLIGLLAQGALPADELASNLGLSPSELAPQLETLISAGVISRQDHRYVLDEAALEAFRVRMLHQPRQSFTPPAYLTEQDAVIIRKLAAPDGSLTRLPKQLKQWMAVLRYVLPVFEPGASYTEKQVNSLLMRFHADTAVLRRFLVDTGLLGRERDGSRYWRELQNG